jgi:hypothetical protein
MPTVTNQTNQKKKPVAYTNDNVLEALRGVGTNVGKTVVKDVAAQSAADALAAIFGGPVRETRTPPEAEPQVRERAPEMRPVHPVMHREEAGIKEKIEAVRSELKALATSIKHLNIEMQKAVAEVPVDPGVYHLNFFDRLRTILAVMREQIDDSRTWMAMSQTRRKKMGYWGMFKKHGTTFGLSNERSIATQAG